MSGDLSYSLNQFSLKLFTQLSAGKAENFFVSPFSISTALSMCFAGAEGETATQLKELLNLDEFEKKEDIYKITKSYLTKINEASTSSLTLNTANKLYPRQGLDLEKKFVDAVRSHFLSEVQSLDFAKNTESAKSINDWVATQTKDKIKDLVSPDILDADTALVLVNAIYFKGLWANPFKKEMTNKQEFFLADGKKVEVDMMFLNGKKFMVAPEVQSLPALVCQLPYQGDKMAMTIMLPNEGVSLDDLEHALCHSRMFNILDHVLKSDEYNEEKVNIVLPKFKLEYKDELSSHFKKLGAELPFTEGKADFTGVHKTAPNLHISKVVHQAVVEVNEEGTEAAAATAVMMMTRMAMIDPVLELRCDRPFIFIIHEKVHNAVLFIGKCVNPLES